MLFAWYLHQTFFTLVCICCIHYEIMYGDQEFPYTQHTEGPSEKMIWLHILTDLTYPCDIWLTPQLTVFYPPQLRRLFTLYRQSKGTREGAKHCRLNQCGRTLSHWLSKHLWTLYVSVHVRKLHYSDSSFSTWVNCSYSYIKCSVLILRSS